MTRPSDLIRKKRDGDNLSAEELEAFVHGVTSGDFDDAQVGAFLMAVYWQGLDAQEQAALTLAMRDSGDVLQWGDLPGPVLDKHSTGGVGDLVSLVLAPMLAACGAFVPMISGRGLGHTGGTLDKLESIPGFTVNPSRALMQQCVRDTGFALIGQDDRLAPADRRLYATRDVTATVSCRPLIVASILSKKLAEGLDALVMDIKVGNGAIMQTEAEAVQLGQAIVDVAGAAGLPCSALVTDMNQPLASSAGNALEVHEALRFLKGESVNSRLESVVFSLCSELMVNSGLVADHKPAQDQLRSVLDNGSAAERFARLVALQGGPADLLDNPEARLPAAPVIHDVLAPVDGYLTELDTRALGRVVQVLGGGRTHADQEINPAVGLDRLPELGQRVEQGMPLLQVHAASTGNAERATAACLAAMSFADAPSSGETRVIHRRLTG